MNKMMASCSVALATLALQQPAYAQRVVVCCDSTIASRVSGLGFNVTDLASPDDVTVSSLRGSDVLFITDGQAAGLADKAPHLWAWVRRGHGMVVEQPDQKGPVRVLPPGIRIEVLSKNFDGSTSHPDPARDVQITPLGNTHPITAGLSTADLSENYDRVLATAVPAEWAVLGVQTSNPSYVALAAVQWGKGRIVFETGNSLYFAMDSGSDLYLGRMISWAAGADPLR